MHNTCKCNSTQRHSSKSGIWPWPKTTMILVGSIISFSLDARFGVTRDDGSFPFMSADISTNGVAAKSRDESISRGLRERDSSRIIGERKKLTIHLDPDAVFVATQGHSIRGGGGEGEEDRERQRLHVSTIERYVRLQRCTRANEGRPRSLKRHSHGGRHYILSFTRSTPRIGIHLFFFHLALTSIRVSSFKGYFRNRRMHSDGSRATSLGRGLFTRLDLLTPIPLHGGNFGGGMGEENNIQYSRDTGYPVSTHGRLVGRSVSRAHVWSCEPDLIRKPSS